MKKQTLLLCMFSLLQLQLAASIHDQKSFIENDLTQQDINNHYDDFVKNTKSQKDRLRSFWAGLGKGVVKFFTLGKIQGDDALAELARAYGYDEYSRRLVSLGKIILDEHWQERLAVLLHCTEEDIDYLNRAKKYILDNMTAPYDTHKALNETVYYMNHFHADELQRRNNLSQDFTQQLKDNSQKINGEFPMYHYIVEYKERNNGEIPPTEVPNLLLTYMFALYKITTKGS